MFLCRQDNKGDISRPSSRRASGENLGDASHGFGSRVLTAEAAAAAAGLHDNDIISAGPRPTPPGLLAVCCTIKPFKAQLLKLLYLAIQA